MRLFLISFISIFVANFVLAADYQSAIAVADSLYDVRQYDSAISLLQNNLNRLAEDNVISDTIKGELLHGLGKNYIASGDHAKGESFTQQAVTLRETVLGINHSEVGRSLNLLGEAYLRQAKLTQAEPAFIRSTEILLKNQGVHSKDYLMAKINIGILYSFSGRLDEAEDLCVEALDQAEAFFGKNDKSMMRFLNTLAIVYHNQSRFAEAEELLNRLVVLLIENYGPDHINVGLFQNNLAMVLHAQGKFITAEQMQLESIRIREKALSPEHYEVAKGLNNLAMIYMDLRRFDDAEPILLRALEIKENALGPEHLDLASTLTNLANLYQYTGFKDKSIDLHKRAIDIVIKTSGEEHAILPGMIANLAEVYLNYEEYAIAESLYVHSLEVRKRAAGENHPHISYNLNALGELAIKKEEYTRAESLLVQSLAILENTYGVDNIQNAHTLDLLSQVRHCRKDFDTAFAYSSRAYKLRIDNLIENFSILTEIDALEYSQLMRTTLDHMLSCYLDWNTTDTEMRDSIVSAIIKCKGLITDLMYQRQTKNFRVTDSTTTQLLSQLNRKKHKLANLFINGPDNDIDAYKAEVDTVERDIKSLDLALIGHSDQYSENLIKKPLDIAAIISGIPKNSALVEFMEYGHYVPETDSTIPRYLALIITRDNDPRIIDIGNVEDINAGVSEYSRHMYRIARMRGEASAADKEEYQYISSDLFQALWEPLRQHVSQKEMLFICPDGLLNMFAFGTLLDGDTYLIERVNIHYLSSCRDIPRLNTPCIPGKGLIAFADPDYSVRDMVGCGEKNRMPDSDENDDDNGLRGFRFNCKGMEDISLKRLPGTRREVRSLVKTIKGRSDIPVTEYYDACASEDKIKTEAPGNRYIHLATHGYYIENTCQIESETNIRYSGENPLLLSGLFLAGANSDARQADVPLGEDGILTAMEVSALNLQGVDLVVLSGCETGLGEIKTGEGVYGLRRVFQIAGSRTVICSLWPVNDITTAEILSKLYDASDVAIADKMYRVTNDRISQLRNEGKSDHPFNWAGFIATGDWK